MQIETLIRYIRPGVIVLVNLGLGEAATKSVGTAANTVAAGNDSRLNTLDGKTGGLINGNTTLNVGSFFCGYGADFGFNKTSSGAVVGSGTTRNLFARCNNNATQRWEMDCFDNGSDIQARLVAFNGNDFNAFYAGVTGCGDSKRGAFAYVSSDRALKEKIQDSDKARAWDRLSKIKTRDFIWKSDGRADRGFIAQELAEIDDKYAYTPAGASIMGVSDRAIMADMLVVLIDVKTAIQMRDDSISELQKRMEAIDGLDA
ncbi:tail fiber domain-containing protein [Pantoea sp. EKM20T]|uniref:tail fiber domain-containing protein n=1 Tax=Pantoea sp. EKM20T TaxID=2708059 RepID=UPI00142D361A|nr:tail fiber domain-containing protein [Pantoea sp. EKM20T]KAF6685047.1 tail fiber domain-containing protein [Pantoea sp. EKM20T]